MIGTLIRWVLRMLSQKSPDLHENMLTSTRRPKKQILINILVATTETSKGPMDTYRRFSRKCEALAWNYAYCIFALLRQAIGSDKKQPLGMLPVSASLPNIVMPKRRLHERDPWNFKRPFSPGREIMQRCFCNLYFGPYTVHASPAIGADGRYFTQRLLDLANQKHSIEQEDIL